MSERTIYKLSGYDAKNEAWTWRIARGYEIHAGDIFRVKLPQGDKPGGMTTPDLRDGNGNYVFLAKQPARMVQGDDGSSQWQTDARPATENEMRENCGLSPKTKSGGVREGMPDA